MPENLRIAIYYQNNLRSVFTESLVLELKNSMMFIYILRVQKGEIISFSRNSGIETFSASQSGIKKILIEYVYQGYKLHRFCRQK